MHAPTRNRRIWVAILTLVCFFLCLLIVLDEKMIPRYAVHWRSQLIAEDQKDGECGIKWQNHKINLTFYEITRYQCERYVPGSSSRPEQVKPLDENPAIRLDPNRFLLPIVFNGPNNQITGVREAIYVAIMLNRTIVLPKFYKHHSDTSHDLPSPKLPSIFPGHRLDIDDVCSYVSCVTMDQFQKACAGQVDGVFHIVRYNRGDIGGWEKYTGMSLKRIRAAHSKEPEVTLIPTTPINKDEKSRKFHPEDIIPLFNSPVRCVIYPRPLYNLHTAPPKNDRFAKNLPLVEKFEDIAKFPANRLMRSIVKHTGSPKYIKQIAQEFVNVTIGRQPFIAVHWRYNKGDYMRRCASLKPGSNKVRENICNNALQIQPRDIADSIESRINFLRNQSRCYNIQNIYIASPPGEREVVAAVAEILFHRHGWITRSSLDLDKFLNDKIKRCQTLRKHFYDIVSTLEMEICGFSLSFLGSTRSSWTTNVYLMRRGSTLEHVLPQYDDDVFKSSLEARKKRTASRP